jgi:hypothetical protein
MHRSRLEIRFTPDELNLLAQKARSAGFCHKAEYIRYLIFRDSLMAEKIDQIHKKVMGDE